jgi:2'-5' RNA ligase
MTNRLFVAVKIPQPVAEKIEEIRKEAYPVPNNYRWEPKEKYHLTLKFLGDIEVSRNEAIINALDEVASRNAKISLEFDKFGFFKKSPVAGILWFGFKAGKNIYDIAEQTDIKLNGLGFEREKRPFKPHLTLLRLKGNEDPNLLKSILDFNVPQADFVADELALMESELLQKGSLYKEVTKFKLNY